MRVSYSIEQRRQAIATYKRTGSVTKTIALLGYPSQHTLHAWIRNPKKYTSKIKSKQAIKGPKHYSYEIKKKAVSLVLDGYDIHKVAEKHNITSYAVIYEWIKIYRIGGEFALMSKKEKASYLGHKTRAQLEASLPDDPAELKRMLADSIVDVAILKKQLELAKKSPGGTPNKLPPKTKSKIASDLREDFPLQVLLLRLGLKPSSYYYGLNSFKTPDKYSNIRKKIYEIAKDSLFTYGAYRVWHCLKREGIRISEKVIRRLMKEDRVLVRYATRKRKYPSYIDEITPAVKDRVKRKFRANQPNRLWLTDITEFRVGTKKMYLSPMIDCYDGKVVSWSMSSSPDYELVETMLENAIKTLSKTELNLCKSNKARLIIHTDRGGHYRGARWIERLEGLHIDRSMSRKGNSGDNAACEGFFGRLKSEMFYGRQWSDISELKEEISAYIDFYNTRRITTKFNGLTILEHRLTG